MFIAACIAASTLSTLSVSVLGGAGRSEGILDAKGLKFGLKNSISLVADKAELLITTNYRLIDYAIL